VIVYILLCGFPPFYGDNDAQMFKRIKAGHYKFLSPYWDPISADAKDFVRNLLVVDPRKRMTAAEALNHRWLGRASNVSTKNLFAVSTNATSAMDDPRITQSPAGDTAPACEPRGLKAQMMQYNVDRKVALPENLRRAFDLPESETRMGKFTCSLGMSFGQLHITTGHVCFLASLGGPKVNLLLSDIKVLAKKKRFFLTPGKGHSLHITDQSATYEFHGISERDKCAIIILDACTRRGIKPTMLEVGH